MEPVLQELFSGDDARAEAVIPRLTTLTGQAAQEVRAALVERLAAAEAELRWWAVRGLAALPGDAPENRDVAALLVLALRDPEASVRQCAALALRSHPDPACIPALAAALADPDPLAARLAADSLEAIGQPAVNALIAALQNGPQPVKLHAVRALAAIQDPRSIPALFEALSNDSALMEYWADLGLGRMGVGTAFFLPD